MRSLRAGVMGSMRAWLPSRRSTAHQRGAWVMTVLGHVRSGRSMGANGVYRPKGIAEGRCALRMSYATERSNPPGVWVVMLCS